MAATNTTAESTACPICEYKVGTGDHCPFCGYRLRLTRRRRKRKSKKKRLCRQEHTSGTQGNTTHSAMSEQTSCNDSHSRALDHSECAICHQTTIDIASIINNDDVVERVFGLGESDEVPRGAEPLSVFYPDLQPLPVFYPEMAQNSLS